MTVSADFWKTYAGLALLCGERIAFTAAGRKHLTPRLAKAGFNLKSIKTERRFGEVMSMVCKAERADRFVADLNANTASLEALMNSPHATAIERAAIRRVLG